MSFKSTSSTDQNTKSGLTFISREETFILIFNTQTSRSFYIVKKSGTYDGVFGNPFEGSQSYAWAHRVLFDKMQINLKLKFAALWKSRWLTFKCEVEVGCHATKHMLSGLAQTYIWDTQTDFQTQSVYLPKVGNDFNRGI